MMTKAIQALGEEGEEGEERMWELRILRPPGTIPPPVKICPHCGATFWWASGHTCKQWLGARKPSADEQAGDRGDDKESDE